MALPYRQTNEAHTLVKNEYQPASFPPYRYYIECSCGFQVRVGSKDAVEGQYDAHLISVGADKYFGKPVTGPELTDVKGSDSVQLQEQQKEKTDLDTNNSQSGLDDKPRWKPFQKKAS